MSHMKRRDFITLLGGVAAADEAIARPSLRLLRGIACRRSTRFVFAAHGGLMSYGMNRVGVYRDAAAYVDRVLRGEKPGYLPVQAPTTFELVVNLKAAKSLGLDVPWFLQQRADEVIE